ncbi:ATP-binding protein [Streptomyces cinnamoneus]|uniref:ATP-binding protein n=1 Tax=Streptomyces cinnamoneus TaxID=53446 RepID=UPI000D1B28AD|nr:ATP-binding protein [Streptomyces cinnamoneus]
MATVSPSQPWSYTLELPRDLRSPAIARTTLRAVLGSHGMTELIDNAQLLTSELVTNACLHTSGPCTLRLRGREGGRLRVTVWDTSPFVPAPFATGTLRRRSWRDGRGAESGRGLTLVRQCASTWGSHTYDKRRFGKALWFELLPPGAAGCVECGDLGAVQRAAVDRGDRAQAVAATVAVRGHWREAHPSQAGDPW